MNKQDCVGINNWQEVERRLQIQNQIINEGNSSLVRVNNSLNSFLNALVLNLKDILESQSDISLWFFDIDEPTNETRPYINWNNPQEHIGDFFYSRTKGIVYQYLEKGWIKNTDATLLKAMALTNTELQSNDNERRVFTSVPSPPYDSGDWWIKEDGALYICQIGNKEKYNKDDFITSVNYAGTVAEKTGNVLEVLKGTVITTTDNAVIYLDKATGTTSQISGDSIKTGIITSNNYQKNSLGMSINLNEGLIDTRNFKVDKYGNVNLYNGATVISEKGLMTNLQFVAKSSSVNGQSGLVKFGIDLDYATNKFKKDILRIDTYIPENFTIELAYISIMHVPVHWELLVPDTGEHRVQWGFSRSIGIFKDKLTEIIDCDWGGRRFIF